MLPIVKQATRKISASSGVGVQCNERAVKINLCKCEATTGMIVRRWRQQHANDEDGGHQLFRWRETFAAERRKSTWSGMGSFGRAETGEQKEQWEKISAAFPPPSTPEVPTHKTMLSRNLNRLGSRKRK
ncbi:hypothetical protein ZHAS_00008135 [Anopheles sinensis]|uniref:Uncharacterized protein n=1 Tax=Anopheles sinensis TaxID=74873 RepID=A0A084VRK4_ANOSI|nr:hypothetical protein ZHAS_00008135 [Anopheles sinensis]